MKTADGITDSYKLLLIVHIKISASNQTIFPSLSDFFNERSFEFFSFCSIS